MADETLSETEAQAAAEPKKVQEGSTVVEQHPLADRFTAADREAARTARSNGRLGPTYARFIPPGTQGP